MECMCVASENNPDRGERMPSSETVNLLCESSENHSMRISSRDMQAGLMQVFARSARRVKGGKRSILANGRANKRRVVNFLQQLLPCNAAQEIFRCTEIGRLGSSFVTRAELERSIS